MKVLITFLTFLLVATVNAQWVNIKPENYFSINCMYNYNSKLYVGAKNGIFTLTNTGWLGLNNGIGSENVKSIALKDSNLFAAVYMKGVYRSTDNGSNWTSVSSGLPNNYLTSLETNGQNLFVGLYNGGVFLSTDNGSSWSNISTGLANNRVEFLKSLDNILYVGSEGGGLRYTTDNGANWLTTGLTSGTVQALVKINNKLFAALRNGGIVVSTDNGNNWTNVSNGITDMNVRALTVYGTNIFAGNWSGVFLSTDYGANWTEINSGLWSLSVNALAILGTNIFAGTSSGAVFRRPLSEIVTSVESSDEIPTDFNLKQNYPNPFNPSTKISWQSPVGGHQTLKVYDVLGNEVATLVDEYRNAGSYEVEFNVGKTFSLSSGVYFYKLQVGEYIQTKKMILAK
ncbi:T9SS type A sorting domain-containing protein [Ignavibacterium sp.]|uniref:T9SS type A sorting domain-containing protein n=1 Tax=Ignavibacterium sp. TaxID=2651167 RepID=UPI00220AEAE6|nr:T9SS type A sorting domain-containing protein [Ignavibacterium sp.]BDQ02327.1 MAG: hypothetical protein KatS3mg037_0902 [Ignavibacterium sp.]